MSTNIEREERIFLERLVALCLKNRQAILFLVLALIAGGILAFVHLPIDAFPDVSNVQVEIITQAPGLSPLEIERLVTMPIEIAMRGLPRLELLRSVTKFGLSVVTLIFNDRTDIYFARQLVFERLGEVRERLPEGVEVSLGPISTALGEIYQYVLEVPGLEIKNKEEEIRWLTELRTIQDWVVAPLLKTIPGVNEINSFGGYIRQIEVRPDPIKLRKYGLSLAEVLAAVEAGNRNVGGSIFDRQGEQVIVRGLGVYRSLDDVRQVVIRAERGLPICVGDVAEVVSGQAVRQGASLINGEREVVGGIVMMLRGENSRQVVKRVEKKVEEINRENILPYGIKIKPFYRRSEIVERSLATVRKAIVEGALLVLIILFLFLGNIRGALIVIMAMPLTVLLTFIVARVFGLGANLMSLGGLAISIGMIVDASIIQVENVERHLSRQGRSRDRFQDVLRAVVEVRRPSIFGETIIVLTFLPILSLQGIEGKMFSPLAIMVAIALFSSLLLSIFVVPVLCYYLMRGRDEQGETLLVRLTKKIYLPLLNLALRFRAPVIFLTILLLAGGIYIYPRLGREFVPVMDEGAFDMDIQLLPGISLDQALAVSALVQKKLKEFPELEIIVSRTGQTGVAVEARGVDKTGNVGSLRPRSEWKNARTFQELITKMRKALEPIPGMVYSFSQPIQCRIDELVAGTRSQLILKIFGEDLTLLREKAAEIASVLAEVRGATDMVIEQVAGQLYLNIECDRAKMARYGLNTRDVLAVVEMAVGGKVATTYYEGNRYFDLVLRFPANYRNSAEKMGEILLRRAEGGLIPLSEVARLELREGPVQISRENGFRRIGIELNVSGRDIGSFVAEARKLIRERVSLPPGMTLSWGGQFENQQRAMRRLMIITPVVLGTILIFLFLTFGSLRLVLILFVSLPLALVGGVFSLWLSGLYLSVPASVGFIALLGIAVLNGLMLLNQIMLEEKRGPEIRACILGACEIRLRPVLMTAGTTILGLLPLLAASGPGSEIQRPLAVVVCGGLATSTLLTLIVLPVLASLILSRDTST